MKYLCERRVRTLADIFCNLDKGAPFFVYNDIKYEPWEYNDTFGSTSDYWLASCVIEADNVNDAHQKFRDKLLDSVPKIALVSQCYTEFLNQPFIIHNLDKEHSYFYNTFNDHPVQLGFDDKSLDALNKLEEAPLSREFLYYWQDATNTTGVTSKMLLLLGAVEALCKKPNGKLDYDLRLSILGDELHKILFENNNKGIRHRLMHGEYLKYSDFQKPLPDLIHAKVRDYINNVLLKDELITVDVVNPQRHFEDNFLNAPCFAKPTDPETPISLKGLLEDYNTSNQSFKGKYEVVYGVQAKDY